LSLLFRCQRRRKANNDLGGLALPIGGWGGSAAVGPAGRVCPPMEERARGSIALQRIGENNLLSFFGKPGFNVRVQSPRVLPQEENCVVSVALEFPLKHPNMAAL